jgi:c-di-GMP-binding flagellar brake protein YcgR
MSRVYKRLNVSLPAIVAVNPAAQGERNLLLRTVDISASGAMFCSETSLSPNTPVKVVFLLNQSNSSQKKLRVIFHGRVVRCEPGRFAVAFDEVHPLIMSQKEATFQTVE